MYSCNSTQLFRCSVPRCCSLLRLVANMDIRTAREKRANGCQMSCGLLTSRHSSRNNLSRASQSLRMGRGCANIIRIKERCTIYMYNYIGYRPTVRPDWWICDDLWTLWVRLTWHVKLHRSVLECALVSKCFKTSFQRLLEAPSQLVHDSNPFKAFPSQQAGPVQSLPPSSRLSSHTCTLLLDMLKCSAAAVACWRDWYQSGSPSIIWFTLGKADCVNAQKKS